MPTECSKTKLMNIIHVFEKENPHPEIELDYKNPFTLLVAILLSAQATDKHVNKVTKELFETIMTPQDVLEMGLDQLQESLKSVNHYRNKSKYIYQLSEKLIQEFNGEVPLNREDLKTLPGIGQKSANVFLNVVSNAHYIPVDTHVFRVTQRLGLCHGKTPEQIEEQLENITPDEYKSRISGWLVLHGRYICKATKPQCTTCPLNKYCDYYKKVVL
jgi:endonuclease-3